MLPLLNLGTGMQMNTTSTYRGRRFNDRHYRSSEKGQTTAEYALVLLAAGTIAMLVVAWAQDNDSIGQLFDAVMSRITSLIS